MLAELELFAELVEATAEMVSSTSSETCSKSHFQRVTEPTLLVELELLAELVEAIAELELLVKLELLAELEMFKKSIFWDLFQNAVDIIGMPSILKHYF